MNHHPSCGFKKGVITNPKGRPKGSLSLTSEIKKKLREIPPEFKKEKKTYLDLMVKKMLDMALAGNETMLKTIWQYTDGMPIQPISNDKDNPVEFVIRDARTK